MKQNKSTKVSKHQASKKGYKHQKMLSKGETRDALKIKVK